MDASKEIQHFLDKWTVQIATFSNLFSTNPTKAMSVLDEGVSLLTTVTVERLEAEYDIMERRARQLHDIQIRLKQEDKDILPMKDFETLLTLKRADFVNLLASIQSLLSKVEAYRARDATVPGNTSPPNEIAEEEEPEVLPVVPDTVPEEPLVSPPVSRTVIVIDDSSSSSSSSSSKNKDQDVDAGSFSDSRDGDGTPVERKTGESDEAFEKRRKRVLADRARRARAKESKQKQTVAIDTVPTVTSPRKSVYETAQELGIDTAVERYLEESDVEYERRAKRAVAERVRRALAKREKNNNNNEATSSSSKGGNVTGTNEVNQKNFNPKYNPEKPHGNETDTGDGVGKFIVFNQKPQAVARTKRLPRTDLRKKVKEREEAKRKVFVDQLEEKIFEELNALFANAMSTPATGPIHQEYVKTLGRLNAARTILFAPADLVEVGIRNGSGGLDASYIEMAQELGVQPHAIPWLDIARRLAEGQQSLFRTSVARLSTTMIDLINEKKDVIAPFNDGLRNLFGLFGNTTTKEALAAKIKAVADATTEPLADLVDPNLNLTDRSPSLVLQKKSRTRILKTTIDEQGEENEEEKDDERGGGGEGDDLLSKDSAIYNEEDDDEDSSSNSNNNSSNVPSIGPDTREPIPDNGLVFDDDDFARPFENVALSAILQSLAITTKDFAGYAMGTNPEGQLSGPLQEKRTERLAANFHALNAIYEFVTHLINATAWMKIKGFSDFATASADLDRVLWMSLLGNLLDSDHPDVDQRLGTFDLSVLLRDVFGANVDSVVVPVVVFHWRDYSGLALLEALDKFTNAGPRVGQLKAVIESQIEGYATSPFPLKNIVLSGAFSNGSKYWPSVWFELAYMSSSIRVNGGLTDLRVRSLPRSSFGLVWPTSFDQPLFRPIQNSEIVVFDAPVTMIPAPWQETKLRKKAGNNLALRNVKSIRIDAVRSLAPMVTMRLAVHRLSQFIISRPLVQPTRASLEAWASFSLDIVRPLATSTKTEKAVAKHLKIHVEFDSTDDPRAGEIAPILNTNIQAIRESSAKENEKLPHETVEVSAVEFTLGDGMDQDRNVQPVARAMDPIGARVRDLIDQMVALGADPDDYWEFPDLGDVIEPLDLVKKYRRRGRPGQDDAQIRGLIDQVEAVYFGQFERRTQAYFNDHQTWFPVGQKNEPANKALLAELKDDTLGQAEEIGLSRENATNILYRTCVDEITQHILPTLKESRTIGKGRGKPALVPIPQAEELAASFAHVKLYRLVDSVRAAMTTTQSTRLLAVPLDKSASRFTEAVVSPGIVITTRTDPDDLQSPSIPALRFYDGSSTTMEFLFPLKFAGTESLPWYAKLFDAPDGQVSLESMRGFTGIHWHLPAFNCHEYAIDIESIKRERISYGSDAAGKNLSGVFTRPVIFDLFDPARINAVGGRITKRTDESAGSLVIEYTDRLLNLPLEIFTLTMTEEESDRPPSVSVRISMRTVSLLLGTEAIRSSIVLARVYSNSDDEGDVRDPLLERYYKDIVEAVLPELRRYDKESKDRKDSSIVRSRNVYEYFLALSQSALMTQSNQLLADRIYKGTWDGTQSQFEKYSDKISDEWKERMYPINVAFGENMPVIFREMALLQSYIAEDYQIPLVHHLSMVDYIRKLMNPSMNIENIKLVVPEDDGVFTGTSRATEDEVLELIDQLASSDSGVDDTVLRYNSAMYHVITNTAIPMAIERARNDEDIKKLLTEVEVDDKRFPAARKDVYANNHRILATACLLGITELAAYLGNDRSRNDKGTDPAANLERAVLEKLASPKSSVTERITAIAAFTLPFDVMTFSADLDFGFYIKWWGLAQFGGLISVNHVELTGALYTKRFGKGKVLKGLGKPTNLQPEGSSGGDVSESGGDDSSEGDVDIDDSSEEKEDEEEEEEEEEEAEESSDADDIDEEDIKDAPDASKYAEERMKEVKRQQQQKEPRQKASLGDQLIGYKNFSEIASRVKQEMLPAAEFLKEQLASGASGWGADDTLRVQGLIWFIRALVSLDFAEIINRGKNSQIDISVLSVSSVTLALEKLRRNAILSLFDQELGIYAVSWDASSETMRKNVIATAIMLAVSLYAYFKKRKILPKLRGVILAEIGADNEEKVRDAMAELYAAIINDEDITSDDAAATSRRLAQAYAARPEADGTTKTTQKPRKKKLIGL